MKRLPTAYRPRIEHVTTSRARSAIAALGSLAFTLALAGCGGTIAFQDQTPIRVAVAPPPPPPPPEVPPPPKQVILRDNKIEITEKIQFALGKSEILPVSFGLLDEVAKVMQENPHVKQIAIEGHASPEGGDVYNQKLSQARAEAVRTYIIGKGVDQARLTAKGYGSSKPIASNDSEPGREKNRRVEFNITKQDVTREKVEVDPKTGEKKVIEKTSANTEEAK
jgi:OOP family OmpA-OmpF porin